MHKLDHLVDGEWREFSHPAVYLRHPLEGAPERVVATAPGGDPRVVRALAGALTPPFRLLYVLHRPRGEAAPGRLLSPEVDKATLDGFFDRFENFLQRDSRYDLWVNSPADGATIVWDRHDLVWCYGKPDAFEAALRALGFEPGEPAIPAPHTHHEHHALRVDADALIHHFAWEHTPLLRMDIE